MGSVLVLAPDLRLGEWGVPPTRNHRDFEPGEAGIVSGGVFDHSTHEEANGDLVYTFTRSWSDGTTGIKLSPLELLEELTALIPPPRVYQVRYSRCLAPHSKLRVVIVPTPRQQGVAGPQARSDSPG